MTMCSVGGSGAYDIANYNIIVVEMRLFSLFRNKMMMKLFNPVLHMNIPDPHLPWTNKVFRFHEIYICRRQPTRVDAMCICVRMEFCVVVMFLCKYCVGE